MSTKFTRILLPIAALSALALGGCVVAPSNGYGYYAAPGPVVVAPAPVYGGWGWRGGWGYGHWR
jgi:hypothetical protein